MADDELRQRNSVFAYAKEAAGQVLLWIDLAGAS